MLRLTFLPLFLLLSCLPGRAAPKLTREAVNAADFTGWSEADAQASESPHPFLIRVQVLLDRADVSPGVIDGLFGENTKKAIRAYREREKIGEGEEMDEAIWAALAKDAGAAVEEYEITEEDVSGRYVEDLPEDYSKLAEMEWLGYSGPKEMLAERFHMDQDLLAALNPGADFSKPGTEILVTVPGKDAEGTVTRIVVDRSRGELFAYEAEDRLVAAYPATIGSEENPSPKGTHKVKAIAPEPTYTYNPDKNFQQGDNDETLVLPPGPNGPVGIMWIDLTEPTYGIHGTPEPAVIDKTASHGCVRLTNWDAQELAELVAPGRTVVEFQE
ncbi:MAG TPA: L,D-transpeptidase [Mesorhizobium sp.]|jgi:lipoprotein-anchoring transpeptidase ErfK/SrfK|nr:L,D-transpeptidase [Mesorhizobium sp.]